MSRKMTKTKSVCSDTVRIILLLTLRRHSFICVTYLYSQNSSKFKAHLNPTSSVTKCFCFEKLVLLNVTIWLDGFCIWCTYLVWKGTFYKVLTNFALHQWNILCCYHWLFWSCKTSLQHDTDHQLSLTFIMPGLLQIILHFKLNINWMHTRMA